MKHSYEGYVRKGRSQRALTGCSHRLGDDAVWAVQRAAWEALTNAAVR